MCWLPVTSGVARVRWPARSSSPSWVATSRSSTNRPTPTARRYRPPATTWPAPTPPSAPAGPDALPLRGVKTHRDIAMPGVFSFSTAYSSRCCTQTCFSSTELAGSRPTPAGGWSTCSLCSESRLLGNRCAAAEDGRRCEVGRVGEVVVGRRVGRQCGDKRATVLGRKIGKILPDCVITLSAKLFQLAGKRVHHRPNRVIDRLLLLVPVDRRDVGIQLLPLRSLLAELVQCRFPLRAHIVVRGEERLRAREVA